MRVYRCFIRALGITFFIILVWTVGSIGYVRFFSFSNSSIRAGEVLEEEILFTIKSQVNRISITDGAVMAHAALTWIKGTNLFFTNEHVTKLLCDGEGFCQFDEQSSFNISTSRRSLQKKVCLPRQDLCALLAPNENLVAGEFHFGVASTGQEVYYVDLNSDDYRIFKGTIIDSDSNSLRIKGYGRHGYSGSPVFNSEGQVLGIIRSLDSGILTVLPHYLIFGWAAAGSIKASRWARLDLITETHGDLLEKDWEELLREFQTKYRSSKDCSSIWSSLKIIFNFFVLVATANNSAGEAHVEALFGGPEGEAGLQDFCRCLLPRP